MNNLKGKIEKISSHDELLLLELSVHNTNMKAIIIGKPNDYSYLRIGNEAAIIFKETEVILSKDKNLNISLQNNLTCTITSVNKGELLSQVNLDFNGNSLASIITSNSVDRLNLKTGDVISALIKTNEIIISEC